MDRTEINKQYNDLYKRVRRYNGKPIDLYNQLNGIFYDDMNDSFGVDYKNIYVVVLHDNGKYKLHNEVTIYDTDGNILEHRYKIDS